MGEKERQPKTFGLFKLIRGKRLGQMLDDGQVVDYEILEEDKRYLCTLEDKAREELGELELTGDVDEAMGELVDLQQFINDAVAALGKTPAEFRRLYEEKFELAGGFAGRVFVRTVLVDPIQSPEFYDYYTDRPDRFPVQPD